MIDLENKEERNKLIDDFFNKGLECNIKEVYQAIVNTIADLEYEDVKKTKEIERLNNIIKEVREYIEKNLSKDDNGCGCWWYGFEDYNEAKEQVLEILDKVGSDKE